MRKIKFDKMEQGKKYRLLHGGEKDHGYDYVRRYDFDLEEFRLFNLSKDSYSSLLGRTYFDGVFIEKEEKFKSYPNLDFKVEYTTQSIVVGCQTIDAFTAQLIAVDILDHFTKE